MVHDSTLSIGILEPGWKKKDGGPRTGTGDGGRGFGGWAGGVGSVVVVAGRKTVFHHSETGICIFSNKIIWKQGMRG